MPDWLAPFHQPKWTKEEFVKYKAAYVAKHGYTITIPGFEDIIHLPIEKPITAEEAKLWKARKYDVFSPERLEELKYIKKRRKEKFLAMLASPIPRILNNRAALMTSIDDTQDALSVLCATGLIAVKTAPRQVAGVISGPVGWLMAGTEAVNFAQMTMSPERWGIKQKRTTDELTDLNPATKKGRAKLLKKAKNAKLHAGYAVEALQVTDSVFGVGISLGQLMNLPIEIIAGNVRNIMDWGSVKVKYPVPDLPHWARIAGKLHNAMGVHWAAHQYTDLEEQTTHLVAANLAAQVTRSFIDWNPLDQVIDIDKAEIRVPQPTNILTIEAMEEEDPDWRETVLWPGTGKEWSNLNDLYDGSVDVMTDNFKRFCDTNRHNFHGFIAGINATESTLQNIESVDDNHVIHYDYTAWCKTLHSLQYNGYSFPLDVTPAQSACFTAWLEAHEGAGSCPTTLEALAYAQNHCGFKFVHGDPYSK
ncbi:hypothetical protein ES703_14518 [subsurface metagenome]